MQYSSKLAEIKVDSMPRDVCWTFAMPIIVGKVFALKQINDQLPTTKYLVSWSDRETCPRGSTPVSNIITVGDY